MSRRARSALVAMLDVARLARGKPLPAKALAAEGIASRQFETVLQDLVRAGLLRSIRGPNGGYELARERRRISLGDVLRAVDGIDDRGAASGPAKSIGHAAVDDVLGEAAQAFMHHLEAVTIEDLCRRAAPAGRDGRAAHAGHFDI